MDTYKLREMSNTYRENALLGTWCKTGRGEYTRSTGETVKKVNFMWVVSLDGVRFCGLALAMQYVDAKHRS